MPTLNKNCTKPTNGASAATVTVREDTLWPSAGKMSGNLFVERNWAILKDYLAIEDKKEDATITKPPPIEESKMGEQISSQKEEKCGWGLNCPFCKVQKKDADLPHQQEMERLNTKYNLDCFSDSELDSELDEDKQYQCEHGYETLI